MNHRDQPTQPLAESGGRSAPVSTAGEPFEALDNLMVVIEALCPTWPERGTFVGSSRFLL